MISPPTLREVENLIEAIFEKRPIFGAIMKKHGEKNLYEYSKDFLDVNNHQLLKKRRPLCTKIVKKELAKRLPKKIVKGVETQLLKKPLVSTTDHHAIIDHPFWLNANIITSLPYEQTHDETLKYLVVFSFASVSNNNASGFPRGILFHGGDRGEGPLIRLPILPDKWKMRTVYGTPPYTKDDLKRTAFLLDKKQKEGLISSNRAEQIHRLLFEIIGKSSILDSEDLCSQITKVNYEIWPLCFAPNGMPDLIYLEAETITREIYLQDIFQKPSCMLAKMLFEKDMRALVMKHFADLPGTFSEKDDYGTYFFWALDEKGHRLRLLLNHEKSQLFSREKDIIIPLTLESIAEALRSKKIYPSMMAVYLTLSLHFGMKCLGGFAQVHDLTKMKEALLHLLVDLGRFREIHAVSRIQTKELSGDGLVLAYVKNEQDQLIPATGIDLILSETKLSSRDYQWMAKQVTLREMITPLLPEIYTVLYPSYERKNEYQNLTPEVIMDITGLQEKLQEIWNGSSANLSVPRELSQPSSKIRA